DGDFRFFDRGEVAAEVAPRTGGARLLRRHRSALADHFGRDALADLAFGVAVGQQRVVGMRVWIDEARRDDLAAGVDRPPGRAGNAADARDAAVANGTRS